MKRLVLCFALTAFVLPVSAHEIEAANEMAAAANHLLAALTPEQKTIAMFAMDSDHRLDWHYIPRERKGLTLKEMAPEQRHLTTALLAASLSSQGLIRASSIMSLEQILATIEGPNRKIPRDPNLYHVSIFGEPGPEKTWGWRFEGHHLSLSFTIVDGTHISATPSFMGTNPDIVMDGPRKGLQVLADEENEGRALVKSLSADQRTKAVINVKAPSEIITGAKRKISPLEPMGINWKDLNSDQQSVLWKLMKTYVERSRGDISEVDLKKITDAGREKISFAWAGGFAHGEGHYYRIQGPTFLIEYDNTQDHANHIHSVYRDFTEDFGEDLLREHYDRDHAK